MDTQTVLTAVLVLLVWIGLFGVVGWVISTALVHIIQWLRKQKQVQRLGMVISQSGRLWWNRHEAAVERLLEFGWEVLINPLFFAFVVYVLFNRITSITDYVAAHPETSFWQQLNLDMEQDLNFYMWVLVIFIIWMLGKAWIHGTQEIEKKTFKKALEVNTKVLEAIARHMGVAESEYKVTDTKKLNEKVGEVKDDRSESN